MTAAAERLPTVAESVRDATVVLRAAGVAEPRADAEVLLAYVLDTNRADLVVRGAAPLGAEDAARFEALVDARRARTPLWHLVGRREFWSLAFGVDARVLTPRPETELLVETVVRLAPRGGIVVDAGTGSGAIAVAVARERPECRVLAVDVDADALAVAAANRARLAPRVQLVRADWLAACGSASVDVVVANPPYVPDEELATLAPEVRCHEPARALAGGADGLRAVVALVRDAAVVLRPGGWLIFEIGAGQAARACALLVGPAWEPSPSVTPDLAGIPRCVTVRRRPA